MMQGIYIDFRRPKSKKEIRELVAAGELGRVTIEATSMFGSEYGGSLADMPETTKVTFVGPDPYTKRNFYGNIIFKAGKGWKVT